ncbi:MAG: hypothetical protein FWD51_06880, partial [Betaproteobacteria bacterium]|nr:hypothetical protein [Betaproteobacteria bacterium]
MSIASLMMPNRKRTFFGRKRATGDGRPYKVSRPYYACQKGIGNLTSKSDLGTYAYPASGGSSVRPHAVSQVTLNAGAGGGKITFAYDANG